MYMTIKDLFRPINLLESRNKANILMSRNVIKQSCIFSIHEHGWNGFAKLFYNL